MAKLFARDGRPRRLVVHIGDHKTGTTAIQYALCRRDVVLDMGEYAYVVPPNRFNHNSWGAHLSADEGKSVRAAERAFARTAQLYRDAPGDVAFISGEQMDRSSPARLADVLKRHFSPHFSEIVVVAYVRPHLDAIVSTFAERTKIGQPADSLEDFVRGKTKRFRYGPRFAAWREAFGDNFRLRPMVRGALLRDSVVDDFIATSLDGLDQAGFRIHEGQKANESLSVEDLMRLRVMHAALATAPQKAAHHSLGWSMAEFLAAAHAETEAPRTRLQPHKPFAKWARTTFGDDARAMDAAFFEGKPVLEAALDTSVGTAPPEALPLTPEAWLSPSEIVSLRASAGLFSALATHVAAWPELLRQDRANRVRGEGEG